jgi:branched-chain amino acid transport system substrate-binding protein
MVASRSLCLGLLAAVSLASLSSAALAADPIKIGVPVGLSGANSVVAPRSTPRAAFSADRWS